jgi:hypothetical protein
MAIGCRRRVQTTDQQPIQATKKDPSDLCEYCVPIRVSIAQHLAERTLRGVVSAHAVDPNPRRR